MEKLHYSISLNAPRQHVWDTMLGIETYRQWTSVFAENSSYKGSWEEGSKIQFVDEKGDGMVSQIARNKPFEFISIEHLGFIYDGKEDTESDEAKAMAGAHENYTFSESNGVTELRVDMDSDEKYTDMFEDMWPRALQKLKQLCEQ